MDNTTITNPRLPYTGEIPGGMVYGRKIIIKGKVPKSENDREFTVNLQCVESNNLSPNIALHFNIRFHENRVVMNTRVKENWLEEEKPATMPFKIDVPFEIILLCLPFRYTVSVNGQMFCKYDHKISTKQVNTLDISSNAGQVDSIVFGKDMSQFYQVEKMINPLVPLIAFIPIYPGKMIYLRGVPDPSASNFTVNLRREDFDKSDIDFHFDVRFKLGEDVNVVVLNFTRNSYWRPENRKMPNRFPFTRNVSFNMFILVEEYQFKVTVDNTTFILQRRQEYEIVQPITRHWTYLQVSGGVKLSQVLFK